MGAEEHRPRLPSRPPYLPPAPVAPTVLHFAPPSMVLAPPASPLCRVVAGQPRQTRRTGGNRRGRTRGRAAVPEPGATGTKRAGTRAEGGSGGGRGGRWGPAWGDVEGVPGRGRRGQVRTAGTGRWGRSVDHLRHWAQGHPRVAGCRHVPPGRRSRL